MIELRIIEKTTQKAFNTVCVIVSGIVLHWLTKSIDLDAIEQMLETRKRSINYEQCNTPEELTIQTQTA
jgi:hypothetical protein